MARTRRTPPPAVEPCRHAAIDLLRRMCDDCYQVFDAPVNPVDTRDQHNARVIEKFRTGTNQATLPGFSGGNEAE